MTLYRTHDERIMIEDLAGCKKRLEELVDQFLAWMVPGPKQRKLANAIIELIREITKKEEELARIKKMSKDYTRRRS